LIGRWAASLGAFLRILPRGRALVAAWLAGFFSAFAFAPFEFFPLLLVGFAVLVVLLDGEYARARPIRNSALLGWAFGFGQFLAGLYWVGYSFTVDPVNHGWQLPFAIALLTAGLALFPALATALAGWLWRPSHTRIVVFAVAFAFCEWLRGHVLTGFPWNIAAYGWGASLAVLQSVAVIGVYGLGFLTILLGASLADLFSAPRRWTLAAAMTGVFVLLFVGGTARLALGPTETVPAVQLRIVQPNVAEADKFKRALALENWERLLQPSTSPAVKAPTILIWPEAAPPFFLAREPVALEEIAHLTADKLLLTGAERFEIGPNRALRFYNSLVGFGRNGRVLFVYDKFHLVPFGEYVPFANLLDRIGITKLTQGEQGFSAGDGPRTFELPGAPSVGPLICYEILFPSAVVGRIRPGWFINVTDDSWFGPSSGPYQHLLTARVRAIEEGIPVVRAANTGISAVIDPFGRTIATLPLDQMGVLDAPLPRSLASTLYVRLGDLAFWVFVVTGGAVGWVLRQK
jgi:apolipoprotein N-acyltransferase